ncbi:MAG: hypothetical protein VKJ86_01010 [Synechococcus sp.]|nr:hypothetical protein [Synechococcus sp.]
MMGIIPFLVGCAVGAGGFYLVKKDDLNRLSELEMELGQLRRDLQNSESNHEQRLREAIAQLQEEYQEKMAALEAQLPTPIPAPAETVETNEIPMAEVGKQFTVNTLEPPILAAEIQCRPEHTPLNLSNPSGKPCDPPILAQGVTFQTLPQAIAPFEPPILAAEICCRAAAPTITLATPSGKPCIPPILAQA